MELESLKEIWNSGVSAKETNEDELQQMLRQKSKSPIAKMKRNLLLELLFVVVLYAGTVIYYFINFKGGMQILAWMLIAVAALYVLYYIRKRKLLNEMECVSCEVKSNLTLQVVTLEKYVKFYLLSGTLLFPIVMMFCFVVLFFYSPEINKIPEKNEWGFFWIYLVLTTVFSAIFTIPLYFLNKWYVNKLYGQHVKKLKDILHEME